MPAIIFDFNGTLFWDTKLHDIAWDNFLNLHGLKLTDAEKVKVIHGKNNQEILSTMFAGITDDDIATMAVEKETMYQNICLKEKMELAPGAIEFIIKLKERGIPYTIATSSGIENVDFYFKYYNLGDFFDKSKVVYSDGRFKSKPDPGIFLEAMKILNVLPQDTFIFEDSPAGIQAAENAKAGKIIIVNSNNADYSQWNHLIIKDFWEIDISLFNQE